MPEPYQDQGGYEQPRQYQPPKQFYGYYNSNYYPKQEGIKPHGANMKIALIMILLGIIIIGLVLVFALTGGEETAETTATAAAIGQLPAEEAPIGMDIGKVLLASEVSEGLTTEPASSSTFKIGDTIWIYVQINNIQSGELKGSWKISYDQYLTTMGPDGQIIDGWTGYFGRTTDDAEEGKFYSFPVAHEMQTDQSFTPGEYEVTIFVDDALNNIEQSYSSTFRLIE